VRRASGERGLVSEHPVQASSVARPKPETPTVILLIRHALTPTTGKVLPGRARGLHLSEDGRRQADGLASRIEKLPEVAAVYASPLERARETAEPIARARGLALRVEPGLLECDFGEWTGGKLRDLRRKPEWSVVLRHPSGFRFPGGESFVEMQARVASTVARLVARHQGSIIVAVSHADPIKAAVAHALGMALDLFQRVAVAPASVTAIAYRRDAAGVLTVNATGDDLPLPAKR
jgi:probable phosphomutase (TIGR03848 family)